MGKEAVLQAFEFYRSATTSERRAISAAAGAVHLAPGEMLSREGEPSGDFGLVGRGDIRVFKTAPNGREVTLYHVRDSQACLINILSVYLGRDAMASAIVEAPTDALVMPADAFRKLLTVSDALQRFVFDTMAVRLAEAMTLVEEITVRRLDARLASWLLRGFAVQHADSAIPVTHDELAVELGTAREVVSRLLKDFERKGAIGLSRGRIRLLDERVLSKIAAEVGASRA